MKTLIVSCFMLFTMSVTNAQLQPQWLDSARYPFASHYLEVPGGKLHYIDEGAGHAILFVHGTPTWSFLFREQIRELSKTHRCIALDHLGFGLSDKSPEIAGTPQQHSENLARLIEHLGLDTFTLVVHDFGGPIGLHYAIDHPEKLSGLVIMNTWFWSTENDSRVQKIDRLLHGRIGKFLYLRMNFSARVLLKKAFHDRKALSKAVHQHYISPFDSRDERYGPWKIGLALAGASDWYAQGWENIDRLKGTPTTIIWGTEDPFFGREYLERWKAAFSGAHLVLLESGHFIPEEKPKEVTEAIRNTL